MKSTIDRAGRVVVPKPLRDALGLTPNGDIEISLDDGRIVIEPSPVTKRLRVDADGLVLVADVDLPPLTAEQVRATLEATRR